MSRLLKALQKANKTHANDAEQKNLPNIEQNIEGEQPGQSQNIQKEIIAKATPKPLDVQTIFSLLLMIMVAIGVYFNLNISSNIASTKNGMDAISNNFKAQEVKFEKMQKLILQMEKANTTQSKDFMTSIDNLSVSVASQINEIQNLSTQQYQELSKTIEDQEKSIAVLSSKYDQLEKTVRNYSDVNNEYVDQLNSLKKKLAEINAVEPQQ